MQIELKINYRTKFGEQLKIYGNIDELGNNKVENALTMSLKNPTTGDWNFILNLPENINYKRIKYSYFLENEQGIKLFDDFKNREIDLTKLKKQKILFIDRWRSPADALNVFKTTAFQRVIFARTPKINKQSEKLDPNFLNIRFNFFNARLCKNQAVGIVGNIQELGAWNYDKVILLNENELSHFTKTFTLKDTPQTIVYKYFIFDTKNKKIVTIETQERSLLADKNFDFIQTDDFDFKFPSGNWRGAGVAIPVFSLRSNSSFGVGEFQDIKLLVDWATKTGLKLIQILPINDTTATLSWTDSYPYSAISVFALHPIYLNLKAIGNLSSKISQEIIDTQQKFLNSKTKLDYEAVIKLKFKFCSMIFEEQFDDFIKNKDFHNFFEENKQWLQPYAAFSYLRDLFGTADFSHWGRFSKFSQELLTELTAPKSPHFKQVAVYYFIQYHLHLQLLDAANYARKNGIILKGDIPIGITKNSVDAWCFPNLFNSAVQAGAPPDQFSDEGQNWKFPTYNWHEMEKNDYEWWQNRLKKMSAYFDAFRIDHILGFFRIWEIPNENIQGVLGYFNPSLPVEKNEFTKHKLDFNYQRFCRPYIREYMLNLLFGELTQYVKNVFLDEYENGKFQFKPEFNTQRKVQNFINICETDLPEERSRKEKLLVGLFKLFGEVLFLPYPYSNSKFSPQSREVNPYVPRHSLHKTFSFKDLSDTEKQIISEIYDDYYYHKNEEFWKQQAYKKLPAIKNATKMMICGEDLGMIPVCVSEVMNNLNILSLEIQRMPKENNVEFADTKSYPYLSVASPSSHDTSTVRGWWEEDSSASQRFYNQILHNEGASPYFCEPNLVQQIIKQHLNSASMWSIFPLQDLLGMSHGLRFMNANEERINQPANPNHYWRYRMHLTIEDLLNQTDFNAFIKKILSESGRLIDV